MATLSFGGVSYTVDHAVKGADFIHGYDANNTPVVSFEGVTDFSGFAYDDTYMTPEDCLQESCNAVIYHNGMFKRPDGSTVGVERKLDITLTAGGWVEGDNSIFSQSVNVPNVTANTFVKLQASDEQLMALVEDGLMFIKVDNDDGALIAKAGGAAPSADLIIQATLVEVSE